MLIAADEIAKLNIVWLINLLKKQCTQVYDSYDFGNFASANSITWFAT